MHPIPFLVEEQAHDERENLQHYIKNVEEKEGGTAKHNFALGDRVTRMMATLI